MAAKSASPVLPYPECVELWVFEDDGAFEGRWFRRPIHILERLFVAKITLRHYEGEDSPCYTAAEWAAKADQLVARYPGCLFVY